jgi:hypothetical protein
MAQQIKALNEAADTFAECCNQFSLSLAGANPNYQQQEVKIGLGIAADTMRWAAGLNSLRFEKKRENNSPRVEGLSELVRFELLWKACNAIFVRNGILRMLTGANLGKGEEERFRVLFECANLNADKVNKWRETIVNLLMSHTQLKTPLPTIPQRTDVRICELICHKYVVQSERRRGVTKRIYEATIQGDFAAIDFPALIYAARNWNVHGVLISSSLFTNQKVYLAFVRTINISLSEMFQSIGQILLHTI